MEFCWEVISEFQIPQEWSKNAAAKTFDISISRNSGIYNSQMNEIFVR